MVSLIIPSNCNSEAVELFFSLMLLLALVKEASSLKEAEIVTSPKGSAEFVACVE